MIIKTPLIIVLFFLSSCSSIDFNYKSSRDITNPIYNKVKYTFDGKELVGIYGYASLYFGSNDDPLYDMYITINENITKKSIQKNQALSKADYELTFNYLLKKSNSGCVVYDQNVVSRFSYSPKSSGENFGSDKSLEKLYELVGRENLADFLKGLNGKDLSLCLNEN